jgi:hypothetical protein
LTIAIHRANAAENNYLKHAEALRLSKLLDQQLAGKCGPSCVQDIKDLRTLDNARNKVLEQACSSPSSAACSAELGKVVAAAKSYQGVNDGLDANGTLGNKGAQANTLADQYTNRVNNAGTYNAIQGAGKAITGAAVAPAELAFNIGRAAAGDKEMQAQLGDMVKGMGNFIAAPIDTTTQAIKSTLDRANQLEATGQTDAAQQLRAELVTNGLLVATSGGTLVVKGTQAAASGLSKVVSAIEDAKAASAAAKVEATAVEQAKISNNFYSEGASSNPVGLTTSAGIIPAIPDKTTTVLGRYTPDMGSVIETQMQAPKSEDFGARTGGFNVLNVPDEKFQAQGPNFFENVNKPWLDAAIKRGDNIPLATVPGSKADVIREKTGELLGNYAYELQYLVQKDYKPSNISQQQWETIKGWFK